MKYVRYTGEFLSHANVVWRVDIMQEADAEFTSVGQLTFPADAPLSIEWESKGKEEVICGSTATLKIISPGDRTYQDLYTIEVGRIRLDVYRDRQLYWSGAIDPEFYEEPYESADGYEVSLTFSDFGILDRIKYDLTGIRTLREIVEYAMQRAGINHAGIDSSHISTHFADGKQTITGGQISVRSENFIDEDGEASTLYSVLEGILQPLAARIVQRAGTVYLYDLNGLYTAGTTKAIEWDGNSQTMGTDRVANNVVVSFSPYSSAELLKSDLEYGGKYDVEHINLNSDSQGVAGDYGDYYSYYPDYDDDHKQEYDWDYNLIDFTIFLHPKAEGLKSIGSGCRYFHILPVTGGASETTGVAYAFRTGGHGGINTGWPKWKIHTGVPAASLIGNSEVLTTNRAFLPALSATDAKRYRVRVVEEILVDARYNPLSGSSSSNDEGNDNQLKVCSGFVFIPAKITLYDAAGKALYHYSNKATATKGTVGHLGWSKGGWVAGADPGGDCWLEYYNPDDLGEDAGVRGWQANRHCIGRPDGRGGRPGTKIFDSFKKMNRGEYLPYPPVAGYIEVQIQSGILGYDYGQKVDDCDFGSTESQWHKKGIYNLLRWCLYKAPTIVVVNNNLIFDNAELEDVEYRGYINKAAKEEISIDTVCGTSTVVCPTAKGIYHATSSGQQLQTLERAGRIDHPETLLIGTLYSQFAERKTKLTGEAVINGGLYSYTEANQAGKRFMLMGETQDVIADCTEAEYCEFRPDEYNKNK